MNPINNLANYLNANSTSLAHEIVNGVLSKMKLVISEDEKKAAISMYEGLMLHLAENLTNEIQKVPDELIEWSRRNSKALVNSETHLSEITVRYPPTREVFADLATAWTKEFNLSAREGILIIRQFNKLLDVSLEETISTFERISQQLRTEALKEIEELASPLVPVKAGVVVLPLIGNIDSERTKHLMIKVVPKISELKVNYLIADFSGVSTINEEMARNLHQIGGVLRLLGIKVLTTGISPRLAQTAVNSGIDLSKTTAFHNVKQALDWLDKLDLIMN
jgi:rsbT co-antagonist protein RsbR